MKVRIGTGPDSWGVWFPSDPKQIPWERYLDEAVVAGYEWTELGPFGYLPTDVSKLRGELERRGLKMSAGVAMAHLDDPAEWPNMEQQVRGSCESVRAVGGLFLNLIDDVYTNLFTGEPTAPKVLGSDAWKRLIDNAHRVADIVIDEYGLKVMFHPHAETHVEYENQIETFLEQTDPKRISLCLDVGHHSYRGGDPVRFMRKHHKRVGYLHFKSVDRELQKRVETEKIPFAHAVAMDLFCEPSVGAVDFPAFRDVLREIDFDGYACVEQDMYPCPFDKPLPFAKRSLEYLKEIGIG